MQRKERSPAMRDRAPSNSVQLASRDRPQDISPSRALQARPILHCDPHRHGYAWHVEMGNERIVTSSDDPEHDACRILAARGYAGPIEFTDGITGKPRIRFCSIKSAARYRMQETDRDGLRLVRRREAPRGSPRTAAPDVAGTGDRGASRNGLVHAIGANWLDPPTITLVPRRVAR